MLVDLFHVPPLEQFTLLLYYLFPVSVDPKQLGGIKRVHTSPILSKNILSMHGIGLSVTICHDDHYFIMLA